MYVAITGSTDNKDVYIIQSYRKENGRTSSRIYKKLGKYNDLLEKFSGDEERMMAWAKDRAKAETEEYNRNSGIASVSFSQAALISKDEERSFNVGYLFLQRIYACLRLDKICRKIRSLYKFEYDINAILSDLVYARILSPSSKLSSYTYCQQFLEPPKYALQDVYRALSVLANESDLIQEELYRNSNYVSPRNGSILYYDCTNYYFEIEEEDGIRRYGKSKEHRPNPIVTMGLFMDVDGLPLAFDIFPGNQNEQTTLKPLETKIIRDYGCSKFIFCSDSGLGSKSNRFFNSVADRSYIITQSLKKLKQEDRECAMNPKRFKALGSDNFVDLTTLDEADEKVFNSVFYNEMPLITGRMDETLIITYSPKYAAYQRSIRNRQLERAEKMIAEGTLNKKTRNPNDPNRFIQKQTITDEGEVANKYLYSLDEERIAQEAQYDGFYAVVTNLEAGIGEIIRINRRRWEIEESFRIMKTEFEARPVYVRREDRIRAHFLTCYISLLVYRLLEKQLDCAYTCEEILTTLRKMQMTRLSTSSGYVPAYKRTDLTDHLHEVAGFRTDYEFITRANMRSIVKSSKSTR